MLYKLATMPGDHKRPNEDYTGALGECAILLDGSGAPGDLPTGCVHGVPWFAHQLGARCLAAMATEDPAVPLAGILAQAIADVAKLHQGTCDLTVPGTPSSVVVMARATGKSLDYLVLGDSALVMEDSSGGVKVISDRRMDQVVVREYQAMLALPIGTPRKQAARMAFVRRQQPMRNAPGGYPIASTDPAAADQAITGSAEARSIRRAAMLSDGVSRFAEFGIGTWHELLTTLSGGGPAALFARVREAEDSDPRGIRWPRAKRHDDVSVVFWETRPS